MDKCGICLKPAVQLFETGDDGVYACFKCQPLVPEVTIDDNTVEIEIEACVQVPTKDELESGESSLFCSICNKTFQRNMQLQAHLRNHHAERRFVCTYCNKAFSQSNNLRAHLRIHTNERPYKCNECGKAFTQVTNLNNHVRLHTGERPFVCSEPGCNKAYAQVTNLNQHRKRHLNGRPVEASYDCTICGEQFQQRNHMYTHRRDAHAEAGKGRLMCSQCDVTFPSDRLLREHRAQQHAPKREEKETEEQEEFPCVFPSCGARLSSARAHTEHLLRAHQLRVLAGTAARAPRGRPPKAKEEPLTDPLSLDGKEETFEPLKILSRGQFKVHKVKIQSMFQ